MAQCKLNPQEYIQNAFAPQVAILCSEDADNICLKNNLRFVELIQPFCRLHNEIRIADPSGSTVPIRNLRVVFEDMNRRPPQPTLGKKLLSEVVSTTPWDRPANRTIGASGTREAIELELQQTTPWFESWRDTFLHVQYPSDHEFTKHYIACIVVVASTSDSPMDQLNRLSQYLHQQLHQTPARFPKWFSPNILKYYLLLHDVTAGDVAKSEQVLEQMSSMFGTNNCHLLQINSHTQDQADLHLPDPWSQFLMHRTSSEVSGGSSSETSSGTGTPREDVSGLPSRVTEGDTADSEPVHPLSPTMPPMDEKNGAFDMPGVEISSDVPVMVNRPSLPSGTPQHHGGCLTSSDVDRIRIFIHEFCVRSLIPHVERQIRYLNEVVTNRSRSKSLLSATRRWLVGNKSPGSASNSVIYSPEATELQTRRLGDLCFMFGLYELAYGFYHTSKNDFKSDQAWLYFAGAQEMAALAAFMHNSSDYPKRYLENSLQTYLNVCKVYNFAIRSTLLSTEVLKHCGEYGEAAMMFIKLTSEESDLLSALMLEQAAHCFINAQRPLPRKFAFHMTLAGHRFSKAGQRAHSLRAYKQAFQVYATRGWVLAEDHIYFTLGKQAHHLKKLSDSLEAFSHLVDQKLKKDAPSQQSATQQMTYLKEYITTFHQYIQQEWDPLSGLPSLPLPLIEAQETRVLLGAPQEPAPSSDWTPASHVSLDSLPTSNERWYALERELLDVNQSLTVASFKPNLQLLSSDTLNNQSPVVPVHEPVVVEVLMGNPLAVTLVLNDVRLLFTFEPPTGEERVQVPVQHSTHEGFTLPAGAQEKVCLELLPQQRGKILVTGVVYKLSLLPDAASASGSSATVIEGQQVIETTGPRLNNTSAEKCNVVYANDKRLEISVLPPLARLSVRFNDLPCILSCGELCSVDAVITNIGPCPVSRLLMATADPNNIFMETTETQLPVKHICHLDQTQTSDTKFKRVQPLNLPNGVLNSGDKINARLYLHAPMSAGAFDVELLFYYETAGLPRKNTYRLLRHFSSIYIEKSMSLKVSSGFSQNLQQSLTPQDASGAHSYSSNLVVELLNSSEVDSSCNLYSVVGLSGNSRKWAVVPHSSLKEEVLQPGESCHLCVKCVQSMTPNSKGLVLSQLHFGTSQVPFSSWWRYSLRKRVRLPDLLAEPPPPDPTADHTPAPPSQAQQDANHIKAANSLDTVVTVLWKGSRGGREIWGQHSAYVENLGDSVQVPEAPLGPEEEKPPVQIIPENPPTLVPSPLPPPGKQKHLVKYSANFPKSMEHDFVNNRLCSVEFELDLHNCSGCSLSAFLNLCPEGSPSSGIANSSHVYAPQASTQILYVGGTTRNLSLSPWSCVKVPVRVIVTGPGTYSLGAFSLAVIRENASKDKTELPTLQTCQLQTAFIVSQVCREYDSQNT